MPPRAPNPPKPRNRCLACLDLNSDEFSDGGYPPAKTDHSVKSRRVLVFLVEENKKKGCQVCFAILKGLEFMTQDLLPDQPFSPPPPPPPLQHAPVPATEHKTPRQFAFLDHLDHVHENRSYIHILWRGSCPLEIVAHLSFRFHVDLQTRIKYQHLDIAATVTGDSVRFGFEIFRDNLSPMPWAGFGPGRHVKGKQTSEARKQTISQWIRYCNDKHTCCGPLSAPSAPYPDDVPSASSSAPEPDLVPARRVLDLSGNPRNMIKLVEAQNIHGNYATLSHCWGPDPSSVLSLTKSNFVQMQRSIRWSDLPPAFQDAVVVASEQKIPYLWIDALCIVADDVEDKNWHVENMHHIYGNSYLNIALARSEDSRRTALGTRWTNSLKSAELRETSVVLTKDGKRHTLWIRPKLYDCHAAFDMLELLSCYDSKVFSGYHRVPLFGRAWALQERILARRTIHFHHSEMVWECRDTTTCECTPWNRAAPSPSPHADSHHARSAIGKMRVSLAPARRQYHVSRRLWRDMCEVYSNLESYNAQERLQAIAGLAAVFQPLISKCYVAGSFVNTETSMAQELVWQVERFDVASSNTNGTDTHKVWSSRVPSWSWVSVVPKPPHQVRYPEALRKGRFLADDSFHVDLVTYDNPPGATPDDRFNACDWTLHVRGQLIAGKISVRERNLGSYQFIPTNLQQFPPAFPPPPPPNPAQRTPWNPFDPDNPNPPQIPIAQTIIHLPPFAPLPVLFGNSTPQQTHTHTPNFAPPPPAPPPVHIRQVVLKPALHDADNLSSMGLFTPDCDRWDADRKEARGAVGLDGVGSRDHTYAYFLLIGQIYPKNAFSPYSSYNKKPPGVDPLWGAEDPAKEPLDFVPMDVGIVLRRADPRLRAGCVEAGGDGVAMERVGMFTAPLGMNRFFGSAQVQKVSLV